MNSEEMNQCPSKLQHLSMRNKGKGVYDKVAVVTYRDERERNSTSQGCEESG
jgi:hypothetical protein